MKTSERILQFVQDYDSKNGYPPTIREIAVGVGLKSSSTVKGHLDRLERDGQIRRKEGTVRAIEVIGLDKPTDVHVLKEHKGVPSVIDWQGRRYIFDPARGKSNEARR